MTTEVAIYAASVPDRMRYAEALSGASLLPESYRGKPANLLLALEYGAALDLAPMVAVQEIHVIKGKPTLSALLQAALVRKAGHRLRVTGDATTATCEIVRADDPEFTFTATWTLERAKAAGLLSNDSWRKYPDNMLKARAISECTRNACSDVIAGFGYTAEELGGDAVESFPQSDSGAVSPAVSASESRAVAGSTPADSPAPESVIEYAEVIEPPELTRPVERLTTAPDDDAWASAPVASEPTTTAPQHPSAESAFRGLQAALSERAKADGWSRPDVIGWVGLQVGRPIASTKDLTSSEVDDVRGILRGARREVTS